MKIPSVGDAIQIKAGDEDNTYIVRGFDPISKIIWLAIDTGEYDGYSGDGLYVQKQKARIWELHLADGRSALPHQLDENFKPIA